MRTSTFPARSWEGRDLLKMSEKEWFGLRGTDIAMVYQDALSSLNPSMLISAQMKQLTKRGGTRSAEELLELVGLDPKRTLESYPHELSGGQRQRVLIAMALPATPSWSSATSPRPLWTLPSRSRSSSCSTTFRPSLALP